MTKMLSELFFEQYRLCKLEPSETVAVIAEYGQKSEYIDAAVLAARAHGAAVLVLTASSLSAATLPPYSPREEKSRRFSPAQVNATWSST